MKRTLFNRGKASAGLAFCIVMLAVLPRNLQAQEELLVPENPLRGRFVFEQKGCINCHAIKGQGGNIGPDLGESEYYGSFLQLAGIMLNHAPEMQRRMKELDLPYPAFTRKEMAELVAYLYYLRYLGEPGDLYRGKVLVREKGCLVCHAVGGKGGHQAPAFDRLAKYVSPLFLAQALWNHGPGMEKVLREKGVKRPQFEKGEIVDLSAYIRSASRGTERERVYMSPGNPKRGAAVFKQKGCANCHAIHGKGEDIGPDLGAVDLDMSVTQIAGLMWNHGSQMAELMKANKMEWPVFDGQEMADLIAYLYSLRFEGEPGNPVTGRRVFTAKGCGKCHGENAKGTRVAPDLTKSHGMRSKIDLVQIMWNHAPVMEEKVAEKAIDWPQFAGNEMADLYAYLRQLQSKHKK